MGRAAAAAAAPVVWGDGVACVCVGRAVVMHGEGVCRMEAWGIGVRMAAAAARSRRSRLAELLGRGVVDVVCHLAHGEVVQGCSRPPLPMPVAAYLDTRSDKEAVSLVRFVFSTVSALA